MSQNTKIKTSSALRSLSFRGSFSSPSSVDNGKNQTTNDNERIEFTIHNLKLFLKHVNNAKEINGQDSKLWIVSVLVERGTKTVSSSDVEGNIENNSIPIEFYEPLTLSTSLVLTSDLRYQEKYAKLSIRRKLRKGYLSSASYQVLGTIELPLHLFAAEPTQLERLYSLENTKHEGSSVTINISCKTIGEIAKSTKFSFRRASNHRMSNPNIHSEMDPTTLEKKSLSLTTASVDVTMDNVYPNEIKNDFSTQLVPSSPDKKSPTLRNRIQYQPVLEGKKVPHHPSDDYDSSDDNAPATLTATSPSVSSPQQVTNVEIFQENVKPPNNEIKPTIHAKDGGMVNRQDLEKALLESKQLNSQQELQLQQITQYVQLMEQQAFVQYQSHNALQIEFQKLQQSHSNLTNHTSPVDGKRHAVTGLVTKSSSYDYASPQTNQSDGENRIKTSPRSQSNHTPQTAEVFTSMENVISEMKAKSPSNVSHKTDSTPRHATHRSVDRNFEFTVEAIERLHPHNNPVFSPEKGELEHANSLINEQKKQLEMNDQTIATLQNELMKMTENRDELIEQINQMNVKLSQAAQYIAYQETNLTLAVQQLEVYQHHPVPMPIDSPHSG